MTPETGSILLKNFAFFVLAMGKIMEFSDGIIREFALAPSDDGQSIVLEACVDVPVDKQSGDYFVWDKGPFLRG